ncbi:MAG: DUF885 domain-containing protein, partial [Terriglobales bacterium]
MKRVLAVLGSFLLGATLAAASPNVEVRRKALSDLLAEQWEYTMRTSPEFASILGDKRYNDKLSDFSQRAIDDDIAQSGKFLKRFEAIDTAGFPEQEALNKVLMVRYLKNQLEDARWKEWEMPVTQISGVHLDYPQLISLLSFASEKDYEDFIARMRQFPALMDQTIVQMRNGMRDGLMPPKFLLEKVVTQAENMAAETPEKSAWSLPLAKLPESLSTAEQKRLREKYLAAVRDSVLPAYAKFAKFVKQEYAPRGRTEPGMWSLPDGEARYANRARRSTTTEMTPEEIHQLGLREVARIEGEMSAIARHLGFEDLNKFRASIKGNHALYAKSREQILELYRGYTKQMEGKSAELFGRLPKAPVEIRAVEEFREKESPGAEYNQGTPDGSRPGQVKVNTGDPESRQTISMESTAYHEGIPGHHLQISIAQELPELPPFRQQAHFTAYVEG